MNGKIVFRVFVFSILITALSSCATLKRWVSVPTYAPVEEELNAIWQGSSYADIVKEYGAPNRSVNDGLGGTIYVDGNDCCYSVRSNRLEEDGTRLSPMRIAISGILGTTIIAAIIGLAAF